MFIKFVPDIFSYILHAKTKMFTVKFRRIVEILCLQGSQKKFWVHFQDLCVQKQRCLLSILDAFWKFSTCKVYQKSSGSIFTVCVQKQRCLLWSSGAFWKFSVCKVSQKISGHISPFMCPKTKMFAVKFGRILEVLHFQGLQKKFWVQFSRNLRPETKLFAVKFTCI